MVSFFLALLLPAGAAVWLGAGGEVGASDGMVAVACPALACRHTRDCLSGARKAPDDGSFAEDSWQVLLLGVSRCPRNDPLGVWSVGGVGLGGLALYPELSVRGKGAWWTGLVASVGGGGGAVCVSISDGDAPSSPELTVGADRDAVDWYAPPPPGIILRGGANVSSPLGARYLQRHGGIKIPPAATRSP